MIAVKKKKNLENLKGWNEKWSVLWLEWNYIKNQLQ